MRLIDADEIIKRSHDVIIGNGAKHRCFDTTLIHEIPTVDAIRVIRCKDCKFLRFTGTMWKCQNRLVMMLCEPNDYCSRAERRNNVTVD